MKLIIKEINRRTGNVFEEFHFTPKSIDIALELVKRLDSQFMKKHFKFEYIIREDD